MVTVIRDQQSTVTLLTEEHTIAESRACGSAAGVTFTRDSKPVKFRLGNSEVQHAWGFQRRYFKEKKEMEGEFVNLKKLKCLPNFFFKNGKHKILLRLQRNGPAHVLLVGM